jgi:hypothetical protein
MKEIIDLVGGESTLTVTNIVLAGCIIFHLFCEFAHYIHEFWSHRKDGKQVKENGELLRDVKRLLEEANEALSQVKSIQQKRIKGCKCPEKEESHEEMDASSSSPL